MFDFRRQIRNFQKVAVIASRESFPIPFSNFRDLLISLLRQLRYISQFFQVHFRERRTQNGAIKISSTTGGYLEVPREKPKSGIRYVKSRYVLMSNVR